MQIILSPTAHLTCTQRKRRQELKGQKVGTLWPGEWGSGKCLPALVFLKFSFFAKITLRTSLLFAQRIALRCSHSFPSMESYSAYCVVAHFFHSATCRGPLYRSVNTGQTHTFQGGKVFLYCRLIIDRLYFFSSELSTRVLWPFFYWRICLFHIDLQELFPLYQES